MGQVPLFDMFYAGQDVWNILLAAQQVLILPLREGTVDRSHTPLCPLALRLLVHCVPEHSLNQAMDGEELFLPVAFHQREMPQDLNRFIQRQGIGGVCWRWRI